MDDTFKGIRTHETRTCDTEDEEKEACRGWSASSALGTGATKGRGCSRERMCLFETFKSQ